MFTHIDHINIVVSCLNEAKAFFQECGFALEDEADLEGDWISAIVGLPGVRARYAKLSLSGSRTKLELMEYASPPSQRDPDMSKANQLGYRHIAFEVADIVSVVDKLTSRGIEMLSEIQTYEATGKKLVYFYGPDKILLELAEDPKCDPSAMKKENS